MHFALLSSSLLGKPPPRQMDGEEDTDRATDGQSERLEVVEMDQQREIED